MRRRSNNVEFTGDGSGSPTWDFWSLDATRWEPGPRYVSQMGVPAGDARDITELLYEEHKQPED